MYEVEVKLTGASSMLMHADDVGEADRLKAWRQDPANKNVSVAGDDRSPAWTWQTYLYGDGVNVAVPSPNFMTCLRQAGARKILKRQTTYKEITQSGIVCLTEFFDFRCNGQQIPLKAIAAIKGDNNFSDHLAAVRKLGFDLYAKRATIGKAKHVRVRPRFNSWSLTGTIQVYASEITKDVLVELLGLAGRVGLGDWRPGCKTPGPFGMFTAKLS